MKSIVALCAALTLGACSTTRYHAVPCLTPEQLQKLKDAEPPKVGQTLTGNAQDDIKIIAGSSVELRTYGRSLVGVLAGCTSK